MDQNTVRKLVAYDPVSGTLRWRTKRQGVRYGDEAGGNRRFGKRWYRVLMIDGKQYLGHRLIFLYMTGRQAKLIEHLDGDGLNNRWVNLKASNHKSNAKNMRLFSTSTSGVTGVSWNKQTSKWEAYVGVDYKNIHLGHFESKTEATRVRKEAELIIGFGKVHGKDLSHLGGA